MILPSKSIIVYTVRQRPDEGGKLKANNNFHGLSFILAVVKSGPTVQSSHSVLVWEGTLIKTNYEEAATVWARKVWQHTQRTATIVVRLACDLLSWHDKYLAVVMVDWNKTRGHWWELCFSLAWGANFPYLSLLTPHTTYLLHLNTADGEGCSCTKQVTQIKSQGARELFQILRVLFCFQRRARETLNLHYSLLLLISLFCDVLSSSTFKVLLQKAEWPVCGSRRETLWQCCEQFLVTHQSAPCPVIVV